VGTRSAPRPDEMRRFALPSPCQRLRRGAGRFDIDGKARSDDRDSRADASQSRGKGGTRACGSDGRKRPAGKSVRGGTRRL
jgi:hypothetical protein